jgi:phenylalanine-4-hydroxylase
MPDQSRDRVPALSSVRPPPPDGSARPDGPHAGGSAEIVELTADHPGFADAEYRSRRNAIAALALAYREGDPVPEVPYTEAEHGVWRQVWAKLAPLHDRYACVQYLRSADRAPLPRDRIPQLGEVNHLIEPHFGFRMLPVAGLVSGRMFLSYLARGTFLSTQYSRHHSVPLYTPEPDIVHELVGHAATFADPDICAISRAFGRAAIACDDKDVLTGLARLYWFTLEFGLVREGAKTKAFGAGLLSSFGELGRFEANAEIVPFDIERIRNTAYDPTDYQKLLFVAPSFEGLRSSLERYVASVVRP